jgi:uncharacterized RDD family membrane protein YckC
LEYVAHKGGLVMLATGDMRICGNCGRTNAETARFCQVCGTALQAGVVPAQPLSSGTIYGGFWRRVAACFIDWAVIVAGLSILSVGTAGMVIAPGILFPWIYEALMTSSEKQATLGKMVVGLVVVGLEGERISFANATGRHFAKYLSALILCIGFIMAAFTERKQGLHDIIADTFVVHGKR